MTTKPSTTTKAPPRRWVSLYRWLKKMKNGVIVRALVGGTLVVALGFELSFFQRAFDSKSIVEDGVVGADFWIVEVDGKPTDRIQHGIVISMVPLALVEPGDRVMELSEESRLSTVKKYTRFKVRIEEGVDYRIETDSDGSPKLVAKQ